MLLTPTLVGQEGPYSVLSEARPGAGLLQPALEERQQYSWECRRVWPGQESAKNPVGHKQTATMAKPTECLFFNKALKRQTLRLLGLGLNLHFCGFQWPGHIFLVYFTIWNSLLGSSSHSTLLPSAPERPCYQAQPTGPQPCTGRHHTAQDWSSCPRSRKKGGPLKEILGMDKEWAYSRKGTPRTSGNHMREEMEPYRP